MSENHQLTLQVTGMDCTSCAATVEQGVAQLEGVQSCEVIFTAEQLRVSGEVERDEVVRRIRELGYDVVEDEAAATEKERAKARYLMASTSTGGTGSKGFRMNLATLVRCPASARCLDRWPSATGRIRASTRA